MQKKLEQKTPKFGQNLTQNLPKNPWRRFSIENFTKGLFIPWAILGRMQKIRQIHFEDFENVCFSEKGLYRQFFLDRAGALPHPNG